MSSKNIDKAKVYKEDIEPLIERISLICKQEKIPMFLSCSDGASKNMVTGINIDYNSMNTLHLHKLLSESATIDDFFSKLISLSEQFGHNSSLLCAIGIPRNRLPEGTLK